MTVQGVSGLTWTLRALFATGAGLLVAFLSAAPAHAEPSAQENPAGVVASVYGAATAAAHAAVTPVADVVDVVAEPVAVVVTPVTGALGAVAASVTPVLPPAASDVAARAVASVSAPVAATTNRLTPAAPALDAVTRALDPVTHALGPVTKVLDPVTTALDPVVRGLRPVTGALVPADDLARGTDALDPTRTATAVATVPPAAESASGVSMPTPASTPAQIEAETVTAGQAVQVDGRSAAEELVPARAPHRPPNLPGGEGAGLPASGSASPGALRGGVDGDVPAGVQPPALREVATRGSPCPAPPSAPGPEVPDSPA